MDLSFKKNDVYLLKQITIKVMELFFESKITSINRGIYIQKIYDPIQTHAVYGITKEDLDKVKKVLTDYKCSRFRTVKTRTNFIILCFKSLEIKLFKLTKLI